MTEATTGPVSGTRDVVYSVAASLDGYIADPDGGYGWIPEEPAIDWEAFVARFDTVVMGRRTWEVVSRDGGGSFLPEMDLVVFSRTLEPEDHPRARITGDDPATVVDGLRRRPGRDIWLMGGGVLFRSLLDAGLVDRVEVAIVPVLLGRGIPLLPEREDEVRLRLRGQRSYPSGMVLLEYDVER